MGAGDQHLVSVARAGQHMRVREVRASADLATNKGMMINRALEVAERAWMWIADADCLFPPWTAREALRPSRGGASPSHFLRRHHLSREITDALLGGRLDTLQDFDRLAATTPITTAQDRAPWG